MNSSALFELADDRHLNAYFGIIIAGMLAFLRQFSFNLIYLKIGSIGHLILFIITIASKRIQKNIILLQFYALFCIILWFDAILLWTGHKKSSTEDIPTAIRIINSTIRGTGLIMNSCTSLIVTLRIWATVNAAKATSFSQLKDYIDSPIIVLIPWLLGMPFFIAHLVASIQDTNNVIRTPYFCVILNERLNLATALTSTVVMFILMIVAFWTAIIFIRLRVSQIGLVKVRKTIDIQLSSRIILFLYYSITSLVVLLQATIEFQGFKTGPTLTFAATGLVAFVIFLIQADVLKALAIYFNLSDSPTPTNSHSQSRSTNTTDALIPRRKLSLSVFLPPKARVRDSNINNTVSQSTSKSASTQSFPLLPL